MFASSPVRRPSIDRSPRRLILLGRLQDAEDDHDRDRREAFAGATQARLDVEKALWTQVGASIAALAGMVAEGCAGSAFSDARPDIEQMTVRLAEAIDDQLDPPAWRLIDAAARLAAAP